MDKQMQKHQERAMRSFEKSKAAQILSPTAFATVLPVIYRVAGEGYQKGVKRGKQKVIETINDIKV